MATTEGGSNPEGVVTAMKILGDGKIMTKVVPLGTEMGEMTMSTVMFQVKFLLGVHGVKLLLLELDAMGKQMGEFTRMGQEGENTMVVESKCLPTHPHSFEQLYMLGLFLCSALSYILYCRRHSNSIFFF